MVILSYCFEGTEEFNIAPGQVTLEFSNIPAKLLHGTGA